MGIGVLGSLEASGPGGRVAFARRQERLLVSCLAVVANQAVSIDVLAETLWPRRPPAGEAGSLRSLASRVRKALSSAGAPGDIERTGSGYRLVIDPDEVDALRFQRLAAEGRARLSEGRPVEGVRLLETALQLWRGPLLDGFDDSGFIEGQRARFEELRVAALENLVDGLLGLSRTADALERLEAAVEAYPYRERLWGQRMVALYQSGRQGDALATYQAARRRLIEDLGVEPGPALQALETQVLNHDPALTATGPNKPMSRVPEIHYADSGGYAIAWQEVGEGPDQMVFVPGFVSNVELQWEVPPVARFLDSIAAHRRLVLYDKRGTGLSDRVPLDQLPSLADRVADLTAVMDAAGLDRPDVFAFSEGVAAAVVLAATQPHRIRRLVCYGGYARGLAGDDTERVVNDSFRALVTQTWGSGGFLSWISPSVVMEAEVAAAFARFERQSASPAAVAALVEMAIQFDVEPQLAAVQVPSLVLHRLDDPLVPIGYGRALAAGIGAELVELPGRDHPPYFGDAQPILEAVEQWCGPRHSARATESRQREAY